MALPTRAKYLMVGAGVHGLSTGYHLDAGNFKARAARERRQDILVVDKKGDRRRSVRDRLWRGPEQLFSACDASSDGALGRGVGERSQGVQLSLGRIHADQAGGDARAAWRTLPSSRRRLVTPRTSSKERPNACAYMKGLFGDWQAKGITSVLHEKKGGYANNMASMCGLAEKAGQSASGFCPV